MGIVIGQNNGENIIGLRHAELTGADLHDPKPHNHVIGDVNGLQVVIDDLGSLATSYEQHNHDGIYAPIWHEHAISGIVDLDAELTSIQNEVQNLVLNLDNHTHVIGDVGTLQVTLDGIQADVQDLVLNLGNLESSYNAHNHNGTYAVIGHTHSISNVTNLQSTLDSKAASNHNHDAIYAPISHTHAVLYAPISHTHTIANTTNLQSSLDSKADTSHTHSIANVTSLQASLDAKVASVDWDSKFWTALKQQLSPVYPGIWTSYDNPNRIMYIGVDAVGSANKAVARHVLPAGTAAGSAADDTWYTRDLTELWTSSAWGASLNSNLLTLPAGTYLIKWWIRKPPVRELRVGVFDSAGNPLIGQVGNDINSGHDWRTQIGGTDLLVLSQQTAVKLMAWHNYAVSGYSASNKGTHNVSPPIFETTLPNVYSFIYVEKIA